MGKRKASKKVAKKVQPKLETVFDCPFCNHTKTVEVKLYTLCCLLAQKQQQQQ